MKHFQGISSTTAGVAGLLVALGTSSVAASAQTLPAPPPAPPAPAAGAPVPPPRPIGAPPPRLGGMIVGASRPYRLRLRTPDGQYVDVVLGDGTTINIMPAPALLPQGPPQGPPPQGPPPPAPPRG